MADATDKSPGLPPPASSVPPPTKEANPGSQRQRQQQQQQRRRRQQQQARQKQIAKLRRENIFPDVPMACLPAIKSSVHLLHDLNSGGFSTDEVDRMEKKSKDLGDVRRAEAGCKPFKKVLDSTKARLRNKARAAAQAQGGGAAASITRDDKELLSDREMNWRYCLAENLCPARMERLRGCWTTHGRELMSQQSKSKSTAVCNEERKAVERCAGMKVQAALRSSFE